MSRSRHGLKALGFWFMVALGVMAFSAVAQAGHWVIDKGETKTLAANNTLFKGSGGLSKLLVPDLFGTSPFITCHHVDVHGTLFDDGTALAHIEFLECETESPETCEVDEGTILAKVLGKIIAHNSEPYVLLEPDNETGIFTNVNIVSVPLEECLLIEPGEELEAVPVTGSTVGKANGDVLEFNQTNCELFADTLLFGAHESCVDGSVLITDGSGNPVLAELS